MEKEVALVEAVLYLESDPIDEGAISRACGLEKDAVKLALEKLRERYSTEECAFEIANIGGGFTITIKREYLNNQNIKDRYGKKNDAKISRPAMETLAIVAYSQPVTRAEIEKIRGVNADNMIRLLLEKGLVREAGKKDIPGRPVMYGTTKEFLKIFGLGSIAELPKLSDIDIAKFELTAE